MRIATLAITLSACVALLALATAAEPPSKEPLVKQVEDSIAGGIGYLKKTQREGSWEHLAGQYKSKTGGVTSLALLALLTSGEDPRSNAIQSGIKYLRTIPPQHTYVVGLQTMAYAEYHRLMRDKDERTRTREDIEVNVAWLLKTRGNKKGWVYAGGSDSPDNSNMQYALLGLHAGKSAGAEVNRADWESLRSYYLACQLDGGAWAYYPKKSDPATLTMTTAGLCGLVIAGMELNEGREKLRPDGSAENCGIYKENEAATKALRWIGENLRIKGEPHTFYNLYGIERTGRLSGLRFLGDHDWYREGCDYLTQKHRHANGSWSLLRGGIRDNEDGNPVLATSFSLLFLSKGRTPVLISKLVHHPRDTPDEGWNNKHHDLRHLTEYVSQNLFDRQPLAWQVFNARQTGSNDAEALAAELLQSPVAYFNGHRLRADHFTDTEKKMLRLYVEQGGFILAEACCGSDDFDKGFRSLMEELFDKNEHPLKPLPATHPIFQAHFPLTARKDRPLYGLEFGCKTMVVYSPKPLAGWWEANQHAKGTDGAYAFQLGANIVAYATGKEPPKPRGTQVDIVGSGSESKLPRGHLKVAQLEHPGERHSGAGVMRNLMAHMRKAMGVDVALQTEKLKLGDKELLNYKFVYMHGKGEFAHDEKELKLLKANLEHGNGLLFADACCGSKAFDASFRKMIKTMFGKEMEPIGRKDDLYGADLNGTAIEEVKCRRERSTGDKARGYDTVKPALEGIKVGGRWVVIYSPYDIGCALEKHASTDCLGHDHDSALRLGSAVILYTLQR